MTGQEIFTMGGEERFVKAVNLNSEAAPEVPPVMDPKNDKKGLRRVK